MSAFVMPSAGKRSLSALLIRTRRRPARTVVSGAATWKTLARTALHAIG
jgi:hypothetical protein